MNAVNNKGFSLIEIMIVVLIIGISASMAVLYIDNSDDRLKSSAQRLLAMVQLARDDAIVTGQSLGLTLDNTPGSAQYFFSKLESGKWVKFSERPYREIKLSHDIQLRSLLSIRESARTSGTLEKVVKEKELIYFLPTGETSEFQIWISNDDSEYVLSSTIMGELSLKRTEQ